MSKSVLIIGANGRLGQVLVDAFLTNGWRVAGQLRRRPARCDEPGLRWLQVPLDDPHALAEAAGRIDVVVHAANPPYTRWKRDAMPIARRAMETARRLGAVLMFPGNVYNFGRAMPEMLEETTPQEPTTRKGAIRVQVEDAMREAARSGLRVVILRAGDFFGGPGRGSWFDMVIAKSLPSGKVVYPGRTNVVHAWAYLPDLARTFAQVAERRAELAVFETLHFPGHAPTGKELVECMSRSAQRLGLLRKGQKLQVGGMPWTLLRMGGLVVPMWRELAEMRYLWNVPHRLSGARLSKLIEVPQTPLDQAMDETLRALFRVP